MRATPPPIALTVAAALVAVTVVLALPSSAPAERWLRPVPGEVARAFSYARAAPFERGAHRGVDLAAAPGTPVRSACAGLVVHAGPVARAGRVVSVRCAARRVSYLPLHRVAVRAGAQINAGAPVGTVAAGHGGLHLGVRRESDRFGYEDPLALLSAPRTAPRPIVTRPRRVPPAAPRAPAPRPRTVPRIPAWRPLASPRVVRRIPASRPLAPPRVVAAPHPATRASTPRGVAPWPVWAGLALLLAGAAGSGTIVVRRRRAARASLAAPDPQRQGV